MLKEKDINKEVRLPVLLVQSTSYEYRHVQSVGSTFNALSHPNADFSSP